MSLLSSVVWKQVVLLRMWLKIADIYLFLFVSLGATPVSSLPSTLLLEIIADPHAVAREI